MSTSLNNLCVFNHFSSVQLEAIAPLFHEINLGLGTMLFEQGDPAVDLYIVLDGEILIEFKPYDGPPMAIGTIKSDGVVGWSAALGNESYTSSAI